MEKKNFVKIGLTRCDRCSSAATHVSKAGKALCDHCASTKQASVAQPSLKSFSEDLANQHAAPR